jgi:hypothetical protein
MDYPAFTTSFGVAGGLARKREEFRRKEEEGEAF